MNIVILDDLATDRVILIHFLERFFKEQGITTRYTITEYESGEDFFAGCDICNYDVIFIDYYMHGMSGMDVAKKMRQQDENIAIFFTTSSPDYAIESFLVKASGYLLKPFKYEELERLLLLCDCFKSMTQNPYIEYIDGKNTVKLLLSDIMYCNSNAHYVNITLTDGSQIKLRSSFEQFTKPLLAHKQFLVTCRGFLINMDYVLSIDNCDFIMKDKKSIPMIKKSKSEIRSLYEEYMFQKKTSAS